MNNLRKKSVFVSVLNNDGTGSVYTLSGYGITNENAVEYVKLKHSDVKEILGVTSTRGKHICRYCGSIAKGKEEDRLCDECRNVFGHSFYSEL